MDINICNVDIWPLLNALDNCRKRGIMDCHPNTLLFEQYVIRGRFVAYKLFRYPPTSQFYLPCNSESSSAHM